MRSLCFLLLAAGASALVTNCTNPALQCSGRGLCTDPTGVPNVTSVCLCDDGFLTWPEGAYPECNHKKTSKLVPFLLTAFVGWLSGAGAFMIGATGWGSAELLVFWVGLLSLMLTACTMDKNDWGHLISCLGCVWVIAIIALWVCVLALIGDGQLTDKQGAPLGDF